LTCDFWAVFEEKFLNAKNVKGLETEDAKENAATGGGGEGKSQCSDLSTPHRDDVWVNDETAMLTTPSSKERSPGTPAPVKMTYG
jgi:hypothetical protein